MLTQLVRYGRMLKVELKSARCRVRAHWSSEGSVFRGSITSTCHSIETLVELESEAPPERVAALVRNAEGGCYARSSLKTPVAVTATVTLNGEPLDYEDHPRGVERR